MFRRCRLRDLLDVRRGMSLSGGYYSDNGSLVRLTLGNFDYPNGGFKENSSKENIYYVGNVKSDFILHAGDIITPLTEQTDGLLGETAIIPKDDKYVQSGDIGLILPKENVLDHDFAYYLVSSNIVKGQLSAGAQQTKIRHTSPDKIKNCVVYVPELQEQKKIGQLLSQIDQKIRVNKTINQNLEQQLKLKYEYWFIQFNFPDSNGNPYHAYGGKMIWNEELKREIPVNWEVKTLGQIIQRNNIPFDFQSNELTIDLSVMPSNSISLDTLNCSSNFSSNLYIMKKGDILFGSIRPYLHKAGFAPCDGVVAGTVHSFHVLDNSDYNFVLFTVSHPSFFDYAENVSNGTKMPVISSDSILNYKVPYLKSIVKEFNDFPIIDTISHNIMESLYLKQLREWLLPLLMNGQMQIEN